MSPCISIEEIKVPQRLGLEVDTQAYLRFIRKLRDKKGIDLAVFTFPFSCGDPLSFVKAIDPQNEFLFYREKPKEQEAIAAGGSLAEISAFGPDRFLEIQQQIEKTEAKTLHFNAASDKRVGINFMGGFSFFDEIESTGWNGFKSASFTLPKRVILKTGDYSTLSVSISLKSRRAAEDIHKQVLRELEVINDGFPDNLLCENSATRNLIRKTSVGFEEWETAITNVKEKIASQKFDKIVLARELDLSFNKKFNLTPLLNRLRTGYPSCCTYLVRPAHSDALIGSSPERLLSFNGCSYQTEALAGSMPRGNNKASDLSFENRLRKSYKNNREHTLVIDHLKNMIGNEAQSLEISDEPRVKKLENVQHLYSPIRFESSASPLQILSRLHPTPALGGYPQKEAVHYLAKNCLIKRGWFGAPLGWINTEDRGEFTVAIRNGLIGKHEAKLFAGCGIVANSDPRTEWEESKLKLTPILSALGDE